MSLPSLSARQRYFSRPILDMVRRVLPPMSDTEREAIEAGTVGWEADLLSGDPDWKKLLGLGTQALTAEEQAFIDGPTSKLCAMLDDWKITFEERDIPEDAWAFMKKHGFMGLIIPKELGGKGFSATANSEIVSRISSRSPSAAVAVIVPNSLGPGELLVLFGTDEQKRHYLPRLADGREVPAFALTSADAGSDATAMTDRGIVCWGKHNGKKTLGMRVTWSKRYISLGPVCSVLGLAYKLHDPDGLLGGDEDLGITLALVPSDTPGVNIGRRHYPGMQAFPNGPNSGTDVFIPMEWIIGGQERIGQGWRMLVTALAAGRSVMLPSMSCAGMKVAAFTTGAYARVREQFNLPISKFEGIQEVMARIAGETYTIDAARRMTLRGIDMGEKPAVVSSIMKYHATERMRDVTNDAMDVHSGKAAIDGPRNYLSSGYRAIPIAITVEGANIMTRNLMIYGQGSVRAHPYLLDEMAAAQDPDKLQGLEAFDAILAKHAVFQIKTLARAVGRTWSLALASSAPVNGPTAKYFKQAKQLSASLAVVSEAALVILGGRLKRMEMLSARLGDALSELYLLSGILKKWEDDGRPHDDLPFVDYSAQMALHRCERALKGVIDNFPVRPVAWLLKALVQPFGTRYGAPRDRLAQQVSDLLSKPNAARERLTQGIFIGEDTELSRLAHAFADTVRLAPVRARMRAAEIGDIEQALAKGTISEDEAEQLHVASALVREVIKVDDFAPEELTGKPAKRKPRKAPKAPARARRRSTEPAAE